MKMDISADSLPEFLYINNCEIGLEGAFVPHFVFQHGTQILYPHSVVVFKIYHCRVKKRKKSKAKKEKKAK
jgi:hypothetical protein